MNQDFGYAPLVELTRGAIVECVHYGAFAVVDSQGKLLCSAGDPDLRTFPRSSMKPFQVLPFVESGGVEFFGLSEEELAIMCASPQVRTRMWLSCAVIHKKRAARD
jgi:L-asparaginase II